MSGNSPSVRAFVAIALISSAVLAAPAKKADRCAAKLLTTVQARARCAQQIAAQSPAAADQGAVASAIAKKLRLDERLLVRGLRRLNGTSAPRRWCDLTTAEMASLVRTVPEAAAEFAETREEYIRFSLGDENGSIPPGGLARALKERQAILDQPRGTVHAQSGVHALSAGLPATPSGWTNLTGYVHPVGRVNDLLIHPTSTNTMWAGTDGGGIWKTTDGGTTWTAINDFLGSLSVSSFAMRPGDPSTIYAATGALGTHTGVGGDGIFKSVDGGTTFTQLPATDPSSNADFTYVYQLAIHPTDTNTVLAATYGGAYITSNGGTTWTKIAAASTRAISVAIHPSNGNLRVIGMNDCTVKVTTDGSTYNSYTIAGGLGSSYTRIALAPSNQSVMYAEVFDSGLSELYRSATTGSTWTQVTPSTNTFNFQLDFTNGLWIDPTNPNHIAVSEFWCAVTPDASVASPTWTESNYGWVDFHGIVGDPGYNGSTNKKVYFMDDGGLYRWNDVDTIETTPPAYLSPNGIVATEVYSTAGRGGNLIFGAQDVASRYYRTDTGDATQRWRFGNTLGGHDGAATAADRTNSSILFGSTQYLGIHRSTDGGVTNGFICQGITDIVCGSYVGKAMFIAPAVLDPNNQSRMLAGAAQLWRSNDVSAGAPPTWTAIHSVNAATNYRVSAIAVAASDSNTIWIAYTNGTVYKTANGSASPPTWTQVTTVPSGSKLRILIDRTNSSHVWIGLSGFVTNRLVVTPDGGTTWSNVPGLPSASVFAIQQHPVNASWLYAGTAVGLFGSEDGGSTWSASNAGPANVQVRDLQWYSDSPAVLLLGTFGRGVWRATISSGTAPAPPGGLQATATSTTSVQVTWNAVAGATGYKIMRASVYPTFVEIGTSAGTSYTDDTAQASTAYLYAARSTDGTNDSANGSTDLATTIIYTDATVAAGVTPVKAVHLDEVRTAVNKLNVLAGRPPTVFTDPVLANTTIKAVHFTELRTAINQAREQVGLIDYLFGETFGETIDPGITIIKAYHINELRLSMK